MYELERMPPLGQYDPQTGFLPDYPLLVMFDEFVISEESYDRLQFRSDEGWLGDWPEVLELLDAEGALHRADLKTPLKEQAHQRGWMLRRDMEDPSRWADGLAYYRSLMAEADEAFGDKPGEGSPIEWDFDPHRIPPQRGSDGKGHILSSILGIAGSEELSDAHAELLKTARGRVRNHLREVNAGLAASETLDVAPMFWAPYREYLEQKGKKAEEAVQQNQKIDSGRLFFEVAFPRYRPDSVNKLKSLRRDSRLQSLRDEINRAAKSGDLMDPEYPQRTLEEALRIERKAERVRTITAWLSAAIGLVPVPGAGSTASALGEAVTKHVKSRMTSGLDWLYMISDGTGHT